MEDYLNSFIIEAREAEEKRNNEKKLAAIEQAKRIEEDEKERQQKLLDAKKEILRESDREIENLRKRQPLTNQQIIARAEIEHDYIMQGYCPPDLSLQEIDDYIAAKRSKALDDKIAQTLISTPEDAVLNGVFSEIV